MSVHARVLLVSASVSAVALASAILPSDGDVAMSPAEAKPLKVGVSIPDSNLKTLDGKATTLKEALGGKPTVLVFYRGGWCPFCNMHLAELGQVQADIIKRGYQIVAISPDTPAELNKTMEKHDLTYKLLSDSTAETMKKFGVAFRLDDKTFGMYKDKYHIDLERSSGGMTHHILPVPSVFLVDKSGKIIFAHSNPDYKVRMKGAEILKAIDENM
ncbi:MAG: AhpC/TSA family protein [Armatimonadetes bacterium]|nr:AhpC/TSA family protein [Armatimonadota bacterium]